MIEAGMSVARRGEGEKHRTHENGYRGKRKAGAPRLNGLYCPECQTHRACYDRPKAAHKPEAAFPVHLPPRSEEHTSELQSLMRFSYAVFCLTNKQEHVKIYMLNKRHNT